MNIPFSPPYIDDDIIREVTGALQSGWITTGPKTKSLEQEFAKYCAVENALAVNSATSALMLVLHWFGVGRGDEVIIPAYTYCATALAVMHIGAKPVMVDVSEDFNIDPEHIKKAITPNTKAIITVDYGGWPCDYDAIYKIVNEDAVKNIFKSSNAHQHNLGRILILADAAHSFGAVYKNKIIGSVADISVFSLHAVKNITSAEGGIICFNMPKPFRNETLYATMRLWSLNGQTKDAYTKSEDGGWQYDIIYPGFKMNMPDVLAAIALAQIRKYNKAILAERKRVFDYYTKNLLREQWAIFPQFYKEGCYSSYHLYPLRIMGISEEQRNEIINRIIKKGVSVNVHFIPLPMLTVFKNAGYNMEDYPQSYTQYANEISLPVYPQLSEEQCGHVINAVIEVVNSIMGP